MKHLILIPINIYFYFLLIPFGAFATTSNAHSIHHVDHMHYYKSYASLSHLAGARKGEAAPGIRDVKNYLHRFGYMDDLKYGGNKLLVEDDLFDESLKQALFAYQNFFKLNKTGVLDRDTISMISKPRCGCPDNIYKSTYKYVFKNQFKRHYKFYPDKPHRKGNRLFYEFRSDIPREFKFAIIQAFNDWEPYLPLKFFNTIDPDRYAPDIIIEFLKGEHGDGYPFDGPGGVTAHASGGEGPLFHFDADENWQVGAIPNALDVTSTARHEIGHLLGLAHSDDESAIMYPYTTVGGIKQIGKDDIAGIKELYYGHT